MYVPFTSVAEVGLIDPAVVENVTSLNGMYSDKASFFVPSVYLFKFAVILTVSPLSFVVMSIITQFAGSKLISPLEYGFVLFPHQL